jgi:AcrR family transcriptional regulator
MTALPPRARNKQLKEHRILASALKVFADQGYSGTSMDAIAALAGVSKPTLYQYFGSKEQLILKAD